MSLPDGRRNNWAPLVFGERAGGQADARTKASGVGQPWGERMKNLSQKIDAPYRKRRVAGSPAPTCQAGANFD